jgi:hypothetical protein
VLTGAAASLLADSAMGLPASCCQSTLLAPCCTCGCYPTHTADPSRSAHNATLLPPPPAAQGPRPPTGPGHHHGQAAGARERRGPVCPPDKADGSAAPARGCQARQGRDGLGAGAAAGRSSAGACQPCPLSYRSTARVDRECVCLLRICTAVRWKETGLAAVQLQDCLCRRGALLAPVMLHRCFQGQPLRCSLGTATARPSSED